MKKLISVFLSLGFICLLGGGALVGYSVSQGYNPDPEKLIITKDGVHYGIDDEDDGTAVFIPDESSDNDSTINFTNEEAEELRKIDVEICAAEVFVCSGSSFRINTQNINNNLFSYELNDGELSIEYGGDDFDFSDLFDDHSDAEIYVTVPLKSSYDKLDVDVSGGNAFISEITASNLEIDVSAGKLTLDSFISDEKSDIEITAGELSIHDSRLKDAQIKQTAGDIIFNNCVVNGDTSIKMTAGELNMTLLGSKEDYTFDVNKTAGEISIDNSDKIPDTNGENHMNIKITAGNCYIDFNDIIE